MLSDVIINKHMKAMRMPCACLVVSLVHHVDLTTHDLKLDPQAFFECYSLSPPARARHAAPTRTQHLRWAALLTFPTCPTIEYSNTDISVHSHRLQAGQCIQIIDCSFQYC